MTRRSQASGGHAVGRGPRRHGSCAHVDARTSLVRVSRPRCGHGHLRDSRRDYLVSSSLRIDYGSALNLEESFRFQGENGLTVRYVSVALIVVDVPNGGFGFKNS